MMTTGPRSLAEHCYDAADGDPLLALWFGVKYWRIFEREHERQIAEQYQRRLVEAA